MESWIITIVIGTVSGGTILGVISFFVSGMEKRYAKQFDDKVATMVSQFNTLADHFTKGFLQLNEKQDAIQNTLSSLMSIEKESTLLREMFMRHEEDNKRSIERIHDRIEEIKGA